MTDLIYSQCLNIFFRDTEHLQFYINQSKRLNPDRYLKSLIYTLGLLPDTRRRFDAIYDVNGKIIVPETIRSAWQTGGSLKVTRLAFQLFTDCTPSAFLDPDMPDIDECRKYSVSDIFCCGYAPFFAEAIKIRYPEYMSTEGGF